MLPHIVASAREIVRFDDSPAPPGSSPWVAPHGPSSEIDVVEADPSWPHRYDCVAAAIGDALGEHAREITHVGSTAVAGLAAKPIIDVDLTVADSRDESTYVAALERIGFTLVVREPWWNEHRLLPGRDPRTNLHVFSDGNAELARHRIFRDWLREHDDDRARYAAAKRLAVGQTRAHAGDVTDYNLSKETVIREIYARAFRALGLLRHAG